MITVVIFLLVIITTGQANHLCVKKQIPKELMRKSFSVSAANSDKSVFKNDTLGLEYKIDTGPTFKLENSPKIAFLTYDTCMKHAFNKSLCDFNIQLPVYDVHIFGKYIYSDYLNKQYHVKEVKLDRLFDVCQKCSHQSDNSECVNNLISSIFASTQSRHDHAYVNLIKSALIGVTLENITNILQKSSDYSNIFNRVFCKYEYLMYANMSVYDHNLITRIHQASIDETARAFIYNSNNFLKYTQSPWKNANQVRRLMHSVVQTYVAMHENEFDIIFDMLNRECSKKNNKQKCEYSISLFTSAVMGKSLLFLKSRSNKPLISVRLKIEHVMNKMSEYLLNAGYISNASEFLYTKFSLYYLQIFSTIKTIVNYDVSTTSDSYYRNIYNKLSDQNPLKLVLYHTFNDKNEKGDIFDSFLAKILPHRIEHTVFIKNEIKFRIFLMTHVKDTGEALAKLLATISKRIIEEMSYMHDERNTESRITVMLLNCDEYDFAKSLGFENLAGVYIPSKQTVMTFNFKFDSANLLNFDSLYVICHEITHAITYTYAPLMCVYDTIIEGIAELITNDIIYGPSLGISRIIISYVYSYDFKTYKIPRDIIIEAFNQEEKIRNKYRLSMIYLSWLKRCKHSEYMENSSDSKSFFSSNRNWTDHQNQFIQFVSKHITMLKDNSKYSSIQSLIEKRENIFRVPISQLYSLIETVYKSPVQC